VGIDEPLLSRPDFRHAGLECQSHDGPDGPVQPVTRITPIRDSGYELGFSGITKDQDQFLRRVYWALVKRAA